MDTMLQNTTDYEALKTFITAYYKKFTNALDDDFIEPEEIISQLWLLQQKPVAELAKYPFMLRVALATIRRQIGCKYGRRKYSDSSRKKAVFVRFHNVDFNNRIEANNYRVKNEDMENLELNDFIDKKLPEKRVKDIIKWYLAGYKKIEIAAMIGKTPGMITYELKKAKRALGKCLNR